VISTILLDLPVKYACPDVLYIFQDFLCSSCQYKKRCK